ncbi:cysteine hydrolase family protein [Sphingopyxis panaciterrulae]|uniref:Ureidoacrylate peracid hydrolase n=1 Tax=Sphingopyxis panaciterrulae TaxID=462372 RepID=A0A7W9ERM9_9SPHN|nr:isochorismatase family cysteine hydrolase [Sphingopyxis panaciterrulae]MBB5707907.1 ureidoacrylate peracid hydrolase [Sphingopyxis panaciterrulae]
MTGFDMPEWARRAALARHGCEHPFGALDPARTALVVIDMQNGFMVREGAASFIEASLTIAPVINRLAAALREAGGHVVWVQNTHDPDTVAGWSNWFAMNSAAFNEGALAAQARGSFGHALHEAMDVQPGDERIEKHRFSAFMPEGSDLAQRLRGRGCDTVLITGVTTNVCCESSARDAAQMNFRTIMVSDATAANDPVAHRSALATFYSIFGDVMPADMVIAALGVRPA